MSDPADTEHSIFLVPLDDETTAYIMELAALSHASPADLIASIVRDVAQDDSAAHAPATATHDAPHSLN